MFLENLAGLDDIDRKILQLLSDNARMSYVDISEIISVSRVTVKNRIQVLEDTGVIEKYTVIINPQKIQPTLSASFDISVDPQHHASAKEFFEENSKITNAYQTTGTSQFHVHAILNNEEDMEVFLYNGLYKLKGLININSHILLTRIKDIKNVRL